MTNISYVFSVLLKKEIALRSDEIARDVEKLIEEHFGSHLKEENKLETTQINRFTGIAYSSDYTKSLQEFVEHQATKEKKAKKKPWTINNLDKKILKRIKEIAGTDSKQVYETVLTLCKTRESIGDTVKEFDKVNRKRLIHDISIELLRKFAAHFGIHYLYKGGQYV